MSTFSESDLRYYTKGQTYSRDEVAALTAGALGGDLGPAITTTNPGVPLAGKSYTFAAAGTYTNFRDNAGASIIIPAAPTGQAVSNGRLYFNGTYWVASYQYVTLPTVDLTPYTPVLATLIPSRNIINNAAMLGGNYSTAGVYAASVNWICTPLRAISTALPTISISGAGVITSGQVRFCFYDVSGTFISKVNGNGLTSQTAALPATARFVSFTVANVVNIGVSPTTSAYAGTVQGEIGSITSYTPYFTGLDATKIIGIPTDSQANLTTLNALTTPSNNLIDNSALLSGLWLAASGAVSSSVNNLRTPSIPIDATKLTLSISGQGTITGSAGRFVFFDASNVFISASNSVTNVAIPSTAAYAGVTIANEVNIGVTPANTHYKGVLMLNYGAPINYQDYGTLLSTQKLDNKSATLSPVYVSYDPVGYLGRELFTIYVQRGTANSYIGYELAHEFDMSDLVYTDQYRIRQASEYAFTGTSMSLLFANSIVAGENECVFQQIGSPYSKSDFTGGYHGDEIYQVFDFYINGVLANLAAAFTLVPCKTAFYVQQSQMHETANTISGVPTYVPGHPVVCNHYKKTLFGSGGYTTTNVLTWQAVIQLFWYHGICCMGKAQATAGFDDANNKNNFTGSLVELFHHVGPREIDYYDTTNSLSAYITSTLYLPSADDTQCDLFVWDRATDSKYYRKTPTRTVAINDVWKSEMTVRHNKL